MRICIIGAGAIGSIVAGVLAREDFKGHITPVNEQLTRMVGEIEEGKRKITPANFMKIKSGS